MAHAELPKLVPIDDSKMCPSDFTQSSLAEVLQSDPVKRLLNQPNIVVKAVPLNSSSTQSRSYVAGKKNGTNPDLKDLKKPSLSILPIQSVEEKTGQDVNLLPSKKEGKSEITILPVKHERKECGHYEPCENIVCDVAVQQYVDHEGSCPMLAINIEDDEINAPVAKHCKNEKCDALSIDHDRCRRALIRLHRCDKVNICDICGNTFGTRKARVRHRICTRRDEYRHNETDGAQILKERMRERELQMLEAAKTKKNDYSDPLTGYDRAMEVLRNNTELIVIPRTVPPQQPIITITSVPSNQRHQQTHNASSTFEKYLPNVPIVLPHGGISICKNQAEEIDLASKQADLHEFLNNALMATSIPSVTTQNQFPGLSNMSQRSIQLNNWLQSHILTNTPIQPKPFLTPIRVVPITNLITQPSLMHQTQGIPKFCIVADNTASPLTMTNQRIVQQPVPNRTFNNNTPEDSRPMTQKKKKTALKKIAKRKFKKNFKCSFCSKRFSTDWYFKMHVAMHKGEVNFSCWICNKSFTNRYDMKKHIINEHKNENIPCDICNHVCESYTSYEKHAKTHSAEKSYKCSDCDMAYTNTASLKHHRRKCHGQVECKHCQKEIDREMLSKHMEREHGTHDESTNEMEQSTKHAIQETCEDKIVDSSDEDVKKNGFSSDPSQGDEESHEDAGEESTI